MLEGNRYFRIISSIEIILRIYGEDIYITIPTYNIYQVKAIFKKVDFDGFEFHYDKVLYLYLCESPNDILKINKLTNETQKVKIFEITKEEYMKAKIKIDRLALLKEQYKQRDAEIRQSYEFESEDLVLLRKITQMDMWLEKKDEFSKILSILNWIDKNFNHNGEERVPKYINSIQILELAAKNGGYLNCRGLAVLTNELLLAAGIYSKFVICEQVEILIDDYHVLNQAYLSKFNKWIMIDPSYNLYLKDRNGNILSLEEIRDALSNKEELIPNDEANYYGKKLSLALYRRSIEKKFYRFGMPIVCKFASDIENNIAWLIPNTDQFNYKVMTDNNRVFWGSPI